MSHPNHGQEAISAVGPIAMNHALQPAIILNPAASHTDLMSWAVAELHNLHGWLDILAMSQCSIAVEPSEVASMVLERVRPLMAAFDAALKKAGV